MSLQVSFFLFLFYQNSFFFSKINSAPLFRNKDASYVHLITESEEERNPIPEVALSELLKKFDGSTKNLKSNLKTGFVEKKQYQIQKLPQYLIFHINRFSDNSFFKEKNPTIVNFPVSDLDLSGFLSNSKLKQQSNAKFVYDCVASIRHSGNDEDDPESYFKMHVQRGENENPKWYDVQDLVVKEVIPQEVSVSESLVLVYERKQTPNKNQK